MLYLVATPIGHLADMTFRAVETLKNCSYILCEDTRHSRVLMTHYGIKTPLKSFHKFNEASKEDKVLEDLKEGMSIALISDAGMPAICDPGLRIVKACRKEAIPVTVIPGASAFLTALALSGIETETFQFVGFLPKGEKKLGECLEKLLAYRGVSIAYETAQRLCKTLALLPEKAQIAIARELTKIHEELREGTAQELLDHYQRHPPKGEIVLLLEGASESSPTREDLLDSIKKKIQGGKISLSEAVRQVAAESGAPRNQLYKIALKSTEC